MTFVLNIVLAYLNFLKIFQRKDFKKIFNRLAIKIVFKTYHARASKCQYLLDFCDKNTGFSKNYHLQIDTFESVLTILYHFKVAIQNYFFK